MNSPRLPPLENKLLPKINYGKSDNKPARTTSVSKRHTNDQNNVVADAGKSAADNVTKSRSSLTLPPPNGTKQENSVLRSFPRFAVLPPIMGRHRSARRPSQMPFLSPHHPRANEKCNGTLKDQGNYFGNVVSDKRRGSGFVVTSSRQREGSTNHEFVVPPHQDVLNNNLEIVGNAAFGEKSQSRQMPYSDTASRTSPALGESLGTALCNRRNRRECRKNRDELKFPRKGQTYRQNTDITNKASSFSANDATVVSTNMSKLSLNLPKSTVLRPLSRGQISFGLEDSRELPKEIRPTLRPQERRKSFGRLSISMPVIQIDRSSASESNNEGVGRETAPSQRIQLLIDSLENAKDELPKQIVGVPYTSVREKRRRSALCRNNSKQVDDFLLVHNLRDLGLL